MDLDFTPIHPDDVTDAEPGTRSAVVTTRRTFGHRGPSRRTFGRYSPSRRTFAVRIRP